MKKTKRQRAILSIISAKAVETQEELVKALCDEGFDVTQATVSRDIKELKLVKVQDGEKVKYVAVDGDTRDMGTQKYKNILRDTVVSVECAMNLVVVKCHIGMGSAACVALDLVTNHNAVGTIAGDDTIFIAFKSVDEAEAYAEELKGNL